MCNSMVEQIDEIIHQIVDGGLSPTKICCLGDFVCKEDECKDHFTTKQPPTHQPPTNPPTTSSEHQWKDTEYD